MIAVVGGDKRFVYLKEILNANGFEAKGVLDKAHADPNGLADCDTVILPFPLLTASGGLNAPMHGEVSAKAVFEAVRGRRIVLAGGKLDGAVDYSPALKAGNGILTAHAAIARFIALSDAAPYGGRAVVTGFGAVARPLAAALGFMGAHVTVAARSPSAREQARLEGCDAVPVENIASVLGDADVVFNTIPSRCIGLRELRGAASSALLIELASAPYGIDFDAARALGLRTELASGLPGRMSPYAAALIVYDAVKPHLKGA